MENLKYILENGGTFLVWDGDFSTNSWNKLTILEPCHLGADAEKSFQFKFEGSSY